MREVRSRAFGECEEAVVVVIIGGVGGVMMMAAGSGLSQGIQEEWAPAQTLRGASPDGASGRALTVAAGWRAGGKAGPR